MGTRETAQLVIPAGFTITSRFDEAAKQRVQDAGQALVRGEPGAADLLIVAALPLVLICMRQYAEGYNRSSTEREDLTGIAQQGLVNAVRLLERRLRDGNSDLPPPASFRAYLSMAIKYHLHRHDPRRKPKPLVVNPWDCFQWLKDSLVEGYATGSQFQMHYAQLSSMERDVFENRKSGMLWDEIGIKVGKSRRQAQRYLEDAKHYLIGSIIAENMFGPNELFPPSAVAPRGPTLPTRKAGVGLANFRRQAAA